MTTSNELFMSILAMDAYNRGYNPNIVIGSGFVGNATVLDSAPLVGLDEYAKWQSAGFYAVSYDWDGQDIIAYRGTDNPSLWSWRDKYGSDIWNAYLQGAGDSNTNQAHLAADFFQLVTGTTESDPTSANAILTGHSLGGGLAGFIGAMYGQQAYIYDNMPFEAAAKSAYDLATSWDPGAVIVNAVAQAIWGDFYNGVEPKSPVIGDNIEAFATTGEFLTALRLMQETDVNYLDAHGGLQDPVNVLHSQALQVSLQFARQQAFIDWSSVATPLLASMFDQAVGRAAGFDDNSETGAGTAASKMLTAIAYSSLDSGSATGDLNYGYVFGNTGIRALFDDADQFGSLQSNGKFSDTLTAALPGLMDVVVQFAGMMANENINFRDYYLLHPEKGVVDLTGVGGNESSSVADAALLTLNISQDLWQIGQADPHRVEIVGVSKLLQNAFEDATSSSQPNLVGAAIETLYQAGYGPISPTLAISAIQFALTSDPVVLSLPMSDLPFDVDHASFFAGGDLANEIDGNSQNNVIVGGNGDDTLTGHLGKDILVGGGGSDLFIDSVTEFDPQTGRKNEDDIYIGGNSNQGLLADFLDWYINKTQTDVVRYTVDALTQDNPDTPEDESSLQKEGIRVTDLHKTKLGTVDALSITVEDKNAGVAGTDILVSVDKVELSDRADELNITNDSLDAPILIDMGKSGRVQSEMPAGETVADNAFLESVDVADYSGVDHGLIYINGSTAKHSDVSELSGIFQYQQYSQELAAVADYASGGLLGTNDALRVEGADLVKLTDHDDVLISAAYGSIVQTGAGNDKIWFTNGIAISDLDAHDRITLFGAITLYGGLRNAESEDVRAFGAYGMSYGLNASGELVISNDFWKIATTNADGTISTENATMYVLNWAQTYTPRSDGMGGTGAGDIFLAEYTITSSRLMDLTLDSKKSASVLGAGLFDILGLAMKTMDDTIQYGGEDPLVLDLDGDGIELTSLDYSKARFDTDDDLYAEATAFVSKDDGLLARDINGNGKIDSGTELFGRAGQTGFAALASLDGNGDGKIDAADNGLVDFDGNGSINAADTFSKLSIWQDRNENHVADVGELVSVIDRGIASISVPLAGAGTQSSSVNGSTVLQTSTYTLSNGTTRTVGEVALHLENQNTTYIGPTITISQSIGDLADLKAFGTLVSLHEAMSLVPGSETSVRAALAGLSTPDLESLRSAIRPILDAWAKGSPVKINGTVLTGQTSATTYDDLMVVRDANQQVVDYSWGFANQSSTIQHFADETQTDAQFSFGSGVVISVGGGLGTSFGGRGDLVSAIQNWLTNSSNTITTSQGTTADEHGNSAGYSQFTNQSGGYVRIYNAGDAAWANSIVGSADHSVSSSFSLGTIKAEDFSFYERLIGESLTPFFSQPNSGSAGDTAINTLLAKMDQALNLFAVRIAVQSGPLAHYFDSISYNIASDNFTSKSGQQLTSVFKALIVDAVQATDAGAWLSTWKPFFDIFLSDYSRGSDAQKNTYGFLVQDMLAAVESTAGGVTLETFAQSFGIPDNLIIHNNGDVVGTGDADIIVIDGGETSVTGGSGADNYIIGKNFQSVSILDQDAFLAVSVDTLRFSAHNANDIDANRDGADLLLTDKATGATLRIVNEFEGRWPGPTISDASYDYGVNQIIFADGSLWNKTAIAEAVSKVDDASTTVVGTEDVDVLQGGKGDDLLEGGGDTDIYRYSRGDGADTIADVENNAFRNDQDMLQFIGGIRLGDLTFERNGNSNDLKIRIKGEPLDSVTLSGQFNATYTGIYGTWYMNRIELITFDNGISLTSDQVAQLVISQYSTSGNDTIYGMDREDFLSGGKGDDFLAGGNQNDTYAFSKGDGHDIIQDGMGNIISGDFDVLQFGVTIHATDITFSRIASSLDTLVLNVGGTEDTVTLSNEFNYTETGIFGEVFWDRVEEVRFTDGSGVVWTSEQIAQMAIDAEATAGDDHIYGFSTNNVLDGGTGDDTLEGRGGDDTYIFGRGYGHDIIIDDVGLSVLAPYYDTLIFKDLNFADVDVSRAVYSLTFTIRDTGETVTMQDQYVRAWAGGDSWGAVDAFVFKDHTFTFADFAPSKLPLIGTSDGETINGSEYGETIDGKGGDDVLFGYGGGDVYIFGLGYGRDTVVDGTGYAGFDAYDYVHFNADVTLSDFTLSIIDRNLVFSHLNGQDSLTIVDQFRYGWLKVEEFDFADGTILTSDQVLEMVTTHRSTLANEDFAGSALGDTYIYSRGGGNDSIDESAIYGSPTDKLILTNLNANEIVLVRNGNDVTLEIGESSLGAKDGGSILLHAEFYGKFEEGVEQIVFADGTIWTAQTMRDMLLTSSASDETFVGFETNDTYVYSRGGGRDTIDESAIYSGDADRLILTDIDSNQVSLIRNGNDVTLKIGDSAPGANDGGSITLKAEFFGKFGEGIEQVVFADGAIWTMESMRDKVLTSTAADENFVGFETSDTYHYSRGGGNDSIDETQIIAGSADKLVLTDINPDAVSLTRNGNDVTLIIAASTSGVGSGWGRNDTLRLIE